MTTGMPDLAAANAVIGNLYRSIGAQLAAARKERGVRQADLATAVGLTRPSITNMETGQQRIQVHTLIAAAQALGMDPADLLTRAMQGEQPISSALPFGNSRDAALLTRRLSNARDQIDALLKHLGEETAR